MSFNSLDAFDIAQRFIGMREVPGAVHNPAILAMLRLDPGGEWALADEVPWCSAFVNYICWLTRLPRSKSLAARSWLNVGEALDGNGLSDAGKGDIVVLRQSLTAPGAEVQNQPGHVGFFAGRHRSPAGAGGYQNWVQVLGGNQGDAVTIASFREELVLSIRRLA